MSTIRIYSKKAFAIGPGAQRGSSEIESFITIPMAFQDMPEKYTTDPTFKLAVRAGDITVINSSVVEKVVDGTEAEIDDQAKATTEEEFYALLKGMNEEDTIKEAEKFGLEKENGEQLKKFKSRIMKAYKEANGTTEE